MFAIVPYHAARVFDRSADYYFQASLLPSSDLPFYFTRTLDMFVMPVLFVIAGIAVWHASARVTKGGFWKSRFKRLLVPLVFGTLVLCPPAGWVAFGQDVDFLTYLPTFFTIGNLSGMDGKFTPGHLWFLLYLFLFSLPAYGLAISLRKRSGTLSRLTTREDLIWLACVVLLFTAAHGIGLPYPSPVYFLAYVLLGVLIAGQPALDESLYRTALPAAVVLPFSIVWELSVWSQGSDSISPLLFNCLRGVNGVLSTLLILTLSRHVWRNAGPVPSWLGPAAMFTYISHQTIVVLAGAGLQRLELSATFWWAGIVGLTFLCLLLGWSMLRLFPRLAVLWGIRPQDISPRDVSEGAFVTKSPNR